MKNRVFLSLVGMFINIILSTTIFASGFQTLGLGAKAQSMGGAFIGFANDATTIWWNPAGLSQLEGSSFSFDLYTMIFDGVDHDSVRNSDLKDLDPTRMDPFFRVYSTEPLRFNRGSVAATFFNPNFYGHIRIKDYVLGLGFYTPLASFSDWEDVVRDPVTNAKIEALYRSSFVTTTMNLSIGKEILPNLSIGVGLNFIRAQTETDATKYYRSEDRPELNYDYVLKSGDLHGISFEGIVGVLYHVTKNFSIGAVYRSGGVIGFHGGVNIKHTALGVDEGSKVTQRLNNPKSWGIGIAYKPINRLTLTADFQRVDWSKEKWYQVYDKEGIFLKNINKSLKWKPSNTWRFGGEYMVRDNIALRGGFFIDLSPFPGGYADIVNISSDETRGATLGFGYDFTIWELNARYERHFGNRSRVDHGTEHRCDVIEFEIKRKW